MKVDNSVTSIDITATANHNGATVTGDGTKNNLVVDQNNFTITVTAEDSLTQ